MTTQNVNKFDSAGYLYILEENPCNASGNNFPSPDLDARSQISGDSTSSSDEEQKTSRSNYLAIPFVAVVLLFSMAVKFGPQHDGLEHSAMIVASTLVQARALAMGNEEAYTVFAISNNELGVAKSDTCAEEPTSIPALSTALASNTRLVAEDWSVCFGVRGYPSSDVVITVTDNKHKTRHIQLLNGEVVHLGGAISGS